MAQLPCENRLTPPLEIMMGSSVFLPASYEAAEFTNVNN